MKLPARPPVEAPRAATETLDPDDWGEALAVSRSILEDAIGYLRDVRDRPVWRDMPAEVRAAFDAPLPRGPTPLAEVYREVAANVMAYPMGNVHPRFWSWYMGASNFTGALGDFLAAIQGSNLGGGNHAAALVDQQVVNWCKAMVGFPASASGTLVSGGSMANIIGLTVARNMKAGVDVRELGVSAVDKPLRFYGSDQIHSCHRKAIEVLGLGNQALRRIPTDSALRLDIDALRAAIAEDRADGFKPCCVVATAGTVNTGAIDDLELIAAVAAEEDLWLHVDGCIGALIAVAPRNAFRVAGIEKADSLALDPHKWLHAPFEAGCALVKDASAHRGAFAVTPEYLEFTPRGLASGQWLHELGPQTSRGFRALKIWSMDGDRLADVKLNGQGCSISQSSASMMSTAVKGRSLAEARATIRTFKSMMSIHEQRLDGPAETEDADGLDAAGDGSEAPEVSLGDLEALQGVVKFPVESECATLSWNTLAQALDHLEAEAASPA